MVARKSELTHDEVSPPFAPLATLAITCFNAEDTIERCIRSAQQQTWPNIEIIVVDDGSSDASVTKVSKMAEDDSRIRLIRHERNLGTGAARTRLVAEAQGEFLAFFDDDDEALPNRVRAQIEEICAHETHSGSCLAACYASRTVINSNGTQSYSRSIGTLPPRPQGEIVALHILTGQPVSGMDMGMMGSCSLLARLSVFRAVGDFDPQFRRCQDLDWAVRLALLGGHFVGCAAPLVRQYVTATEDKSQRKPLHYSLLLKKKYKPFLKSHGVYGPAVLRSYVQFYYARRKRARFKGVLLLLALRKPHWVYSDWKVARAKRGRTRRPAREV